MKIRSVLSALLKKACIIFTIVTTVYLLISLLMNGLDENKQLLIDGASLLFYFIFSLLIAGAGEIVNMKSVSASLRYPVHYVICLFGFYTCFMLPMGMRAAQVIIGVVFFSLVYAIIMGARGIFRSRFRKNKAINEAYQKQFNKKK